MLWRVIIAPVLAGAIGLLGSHLTPGTLIVVGFVIGFFPLIGLSALQKLTGTTLRTAVPSVRTEYPLSDLKGLTVWYEAQLVQAGVDDMQNIASANLVDILLDTRVPVARLVDWVDQACLPAASPAPRAPTEPGRRRSGSPLAAPHRGPHRHRSGAGAGPLRA